MLFLDINRLVVNSVLESSDSMQKLPEEFYDKAIEQLELSPEEDCFWYANRHAEAYVDIRVCGRQAILEMERNGIPDSYYEELYYQIYNKHYLTKRNDNANWWGLYFSPMAEGEPYPKVWVRFPDKEKPIWFFIQGYDEKKGLLVSPNPRQKTTMKLIAGYDNQFQKITSSYPSTIERARNEAYDFFIRQQVRKPTASSLEERIGFIYYPKPVYKTGYGYKFGDAAPKSWDH